MSAETASSSDVASVENGTAVQQNFTPPVSKSALFDNIVEEEGAERERFVNYTYFYFSISNFDVYAHSRRGGSVKRV